MSAIVSEDIRQLPYHVKHSTTSGSYNMQLQKPQDHIIPTWQCNESISSFHNTFIQLKMQPSGSAGKSKLGWVNFRVSSQLAALSGWDGSAAKSTRLVLKEQNKKKKSTSQETHVERKQSSAMTNKLRSWSTLLSLFHDHPPSMSLRINPGWNRPPTAKKDGWYRVEVN